MTDQRARPSVPRRLRPRTACLVLTLVALLAPACGAEVAPLEAPAKGKIMVAFVMGPHATMIDFAGPWEVFQDVHVHDRGATMEEMMPFTLYTVAETRDPLEVTGGMVIIPTYTFADAPAPEVVVVPASGAGDAAREWLRKVEGGADIVMSVCTGAFQLGRAGLLDGKKATTHHLFFEQFAERFPKVELSRDHRFIDNGHIATAAGLTSGIDLALHVVERYFGHDVAEATAGYMEHRSTAWQER